MPRSLPDYYAPGEESEALMYVSEGLAAWKASPGAIEWLSANTT